VKVLVTGGTGFIGSHTVAALVRHGHDVRLLARTPERVGPVLEPHGVVVEVVQGDVTDARSVVAALDGCDAVVHAAAEIPLGSGPTADVNVVGSRTVIGEAVARGLDPIIYTSTVTVYLPTTEAIVTPASDLGLRAHIATPGGKFPRRHQRARGVDAHATRWHRGRRRPGRGRHAGQGGRT
jgi:nucleoside-diphosphate-sugar epimerase